MASGGWRNRCALCNIRCEDNKWWKFTHKARAGRILNLHKYVLLSDFGCFSDENEQNVKMMMRKWEEEASHYHQMRAFAVTSVMKIPTCRLIDYFFMRTYLCASVSPPLTKNNRENETGLKPKNKLLSYYEVDTRTPWKRIKTVFKTWHCSVIN